jgi:succinoglycan biosynthesis protein ExoA
MNAELPMVSIIMPVRNEGSYLRRSLESVFHQDYPQEKMEVIVADGLSTDETRTILDSYTALQANLRIVENRGQTTPTGLNAALNRARGEIIIRVDGHCEIAPDYVRCCAARLQEAGVDGVGGPVETVGENTQSQAIALALSSSFGVGDSVFRTSQDYTGPVDTIPFPAYPRSVLEWAGKYDEELVRNQDDEYNYRLQHLGAKILLASEIRSRYYSRSCLASLGRQFFQYGYWKVRVFQKHPRQMRSRHFVPALFVLSLVLSIGAGLFHSGAGWLPALVAGPYVLGNLGAAGWTAGHRGWRYFPWLPLAFATLHLGYGLGFLVGLLKFADRWGIPVGQTPVLNRKPVGNG